MTIYIAIVIELLLIAALIMIWKGDKKSFKIIWDQIIEIMQEIKDLKKEQRKQTKPTIKTIKKKKS